MVPSATSAPGPDNVVSEMNPESNPAIKPTNLSAPSFAHPLFAQASEASQLVSTLMQMPLCEIMQMTMQTFVDRFFRDLRLLDESTTPFASRCVQLARLIALYHQEHEPDGSFEKPFRLQAKKLEIEPPVDSEVHPLKVFDIGVKSKFLRSSQHALLKAICQVQQRCSIPIENIVKGESGTGLFFAHTVKELGEVLSVEGAQVATLEDGQGRIWGTYLAHLNEIAEEDLQLVERALGFLDKFCFSKNLDPKELPPLPHVAHLICIDPAIRDFRDPVGRPYSRRTLYGDLHAPIVWESWRSARRRGLHSSIMVATCRPDNPALAVHKQAGWVDLTSEFGAPALQKYVALPKDFERRKFEFHILALSTADSQQDTYINRSYPNDNPIVRVVPFVDLDPSNGVNLGEIQPSR